MKREKERKRSWKKEKIGSWSIERTGIRLSVYTVERPDQEPWIIHRESETRCFSFGARTDVVPCLFALLVDSLSTLPPRLGYFWHPVSACLSASCFTMYIEFFLPIKVPYTSDSPFHPCRHCNSKLVVWHQKCHSSENDWFYNFTNVSTLF